MLPVETTFILIQPSKESTKQVFTVDVVGTTQGVQCSKEFLVPISREYFILILYYMMG